MTDKQKNTQNAKQAIRNVQKTIDSITVNIDAFDKEMLKGIVFSLETSLQALTKEINFGIIVQGESGDEPIKRIGGSNAE